MRLTDDERSSAINLIDQYLTYLACANRPLKQFDKCLLMTPEAGDLAAMTKEPIADLYTKATDLDCSWTIKVLARPALSGNDEIGRGLCTIYDNRTVQTSEVSKFRYKMPNADFSFYDCFAKHTGCTLFESGHVETDVLYAAFRKSNITLLDPGRLASDAGLRTREWNAVDERCVRVCLGTAFMIQSFWLAHVSLVDSAPRVSLPTDPTGVKELWKFRDIPEGKKRRDALLHWVSDHWRQNRNDPETEFYVRSHLRGQRSLSCSGLSVDITESSEDKAKIAEIRFSRSAMKLKHIDRRKRRRLEDASD